MYDRVVQATLFRTCALSPRRSISNLPYLNYTSIVNGNLLRSKLHKLTVFFAGGAGGGQRQREELGSAGWRRNRLCDLCDLLC